MTSAGLQGSYAIEDGFAVLLRGSGYAIGKTATGYVLVAAPASAPTAAASAASAAERTMPSITIVGQAEQGATTEGSGSYTARKITIGKGEQSMKDIPQSVSVLTRQRLDDQGITDLRVGRQQRHRRGGRAWRGPGRGDHGARLPDRPVAVRRRADRPQHLCAG